MRLSYKLGEKVGTTLQTKLAKLQKKYELLHARSTALEDERNELVLQTKSDRDNREKMKEITDLQKYIKQRKIELRDIETKVALRTLERNRLVPLEK